MNANWLARNKFLALLAALLMLLVAYPALRGPAGSPVLASVLVTAVFLAGGWVVFTGRRHRAMAVVLGLPAVVGAWTGYTLPEQLGPGAAAGFHLAAAAFHGFVLAVIVGWVYRERSVSADVVAAALCGYLLIGVTFGHVYYLVEAAVPGSFAGLGPDPGHHRTHYQLIYFSFATLSTVGYGDITPAKDTARSFALVEALTGQFYLAVLVADLVGKRVSLAFSPQPPGPTG
ncbi:MAG: potassium channel family protein [Gemmataceae bacterium]